MAPEEDEMVIWDRRRQERRRITDQAPLEREQQDQDLGVPGSRLERVQIQRLPLTLS
jgi:hypothetical protein